MSLKTSLLAAAVLAAVAAAPAARAQVPNFLGMDFNRMNQGFNAQLNGAMGARYGQIQQDVLSNPQAMAAYRAGVCGQGLTPQQFAYTYAATGGCTPQGFAQYNATSAGIAQRDGAAFRDYQAAQAARAQAMAAQQGGVFSNNYQRGMMLGGWRFAPAPNGGTVWFR